METEDVSVSRECSCTQRENCEIPRVDGGVMRKHFGCSNDTWVISNNASIDITLQEIIAKSVLEIFPIPYVQENK